LIDVNQGLLSALGVSHPCLDQIAAICLCKGQLHAKLTGAGGGGFAFALITPFHTEAQVSAVKDELQSQGFECWDTNIAGDGIKLHSAAS
jgi:mevalonate kinase